MDISMNIKTTTFLLNLVNNSRFIPEIFIAKSNEVLRFRKTFEKIYYFNVHKFASALTKKRRDVNANVKKSSWLRVGEFLGMHYSENDIGCRDTTK